MFVKTKNVPNVLKCKINLNFFFTNMGFPNGGRGRVGPPLGKNSHIFPFFYLGSVPYCGWISDFRKAREWKLAQNRINTFQIPLHLLIHHHIKNDQHNISRVFIGRVAKCHIFYTDQIFYSKIGRV